MFDVMIIDDEISVRNRLIAMIDWEHLPVNLVCQAEDSETARELYLLYRPKIIITDINIPIISGLALAEELRQLDPEIRFIVITGYNEFSWAQEAVKLGAVDLLSKPIFQRAINESLKKAVCYFENIKRERASFSLLQKLMNEHLPAIREKYMASLMHKAPDTEDGIKKKFNELAITNCPGPYFTVVLSSIDGSSQELYEATNYLVVKTIESTLREGGMSCFKFFDSLFRLNCVISTPDGNPDDRIEEIFNKVKQQTFLMTDRQFYAGIGHTVSRRAQLHNSHEEALIALNYQSVLSDDTVIHYKNIQRYENPFPTRESFRKRLLLLLRTSRYDELEESIAMHIKSFSLSGDKAMQQIHEFMFDYIANVSNEGIRLGINIEDIYSFGDILNQLFSLQSPHEILNYILDFTRRVSASLNKKQSCDNHHIISMAKEYIKNNLSNKDLSLTSISDYVGLSKIYFCSLFHKTTNVNFNSYLKQARVERAKELLSTTNMKVFEISDAVGFSNAKYFGYVFKQVVGMTPLEYQKTILSFPDSI